MEMLPDLFSLKTQGAAFYSGQAETEMLETVMEKHSAAYWLDLIGIDVTFADFSRRPSLDLLLEENNRQQLR